MFPLCTGLRAGRLVVTWSMVCYITNAYVQKQDERRGDWTRSCGVQEWTNLYGFSMEVSVLKSAESFLDVIMKKMGIT